LALERGDVDGQERPRDERERLEGQETGLAGENARKDNPKTKNLSIFSFKCKKKPRLINGTVLEISI
jgi:hypothetical protein